MTDGQLSLPFEQTNTVEWLQQVLELVGEPERQQLGYRKLARRVPKGSAEVNADHSPTRRAKDGRIQTGMQRYRLSRKAMKKSRKLQLGDTVVPDVSCSRTGYFL